MSFPYRPLALATGFGLLTACATMPQPLQGTYSDVSTASAQQGGAGGAKVRWGGEIIKTEPGPQQTCFYLLSRPLDKQAVRMEKGTCRGSAWWQEMSPHSRSPSITEMDMEAAVPMFRIYSR